jgi:hypothetical protein
MNMEMNVLIIKDLLINRKQKIGSGAYCLTKRRRRRRRREN